MQTQSEAYTVAKAVFSYFQQNNDFEKEIILSAEVDKEKSILYGEEFWQYGWDEYEYYNHCIRDGEFVFITYISKDLYEHLRDWENSGDDLTPKYKVEYNKVVPANFERLMVIDEILADIEP